MRPHENASLIASGSYILDNNAPPKTIPLAGVCGVPIFGPVATALHAELLVSPR